MIYPIVKDTLLLSKKAREATEADRPLALSLLETLRAHAEECVGMAANMIGFPVRIIAFADGERYEAMLNPVIVRKSGEYEAQEGCLSLGGTRKAKRYRAIRVRFTDLSGTVHECAYMGWTAQIIQHEIDHCNGILI